MSLQECIICLDTIVKREEFKNPCSHCKKIYFHQTCWNQYQNNSQNSHKCPHCNMEYTMRNSFPYISNIHYHIYQVQIESPIERIIETLTPLESSNEEYRFYRKIITFQVFCDMTSFVFFMQNMFMDFRQQFLFGLYLISMISNFICFSLHRSHCSPLYEQFIVICQYMTRSILCLYTFLNFQHQKDNIGLWIQIAVLFIDFVAVLIFYHILKEHSSLYRRWCLSNRVIPIGIENV